MRWDVPIWPLRHWMPPTVPTGFSFNPTARPTTCICGASRKASPSQRGLQEALDDAIEKLPIPKVMSYAGPGGYYNDVRSSSGPRTRCSRCTAPTSSPIKALGLDRRSHDRRPSLPEPPGHRGRHRRCLRGDAARRRQGHRELRRAPRADRRRARARPPTARRVIMPDALLDEVTALVEWPAVYDGDVRSRVPRRAAGVPDPDDAAEPEVLRARRRATASSSALSRRQQPRDRAIPSAIIDGNERVLRARLADARFFFDQDRKMRLEARVPTPAQHRLSQQARDAARPRGPRASRSPRRSPA